MDKSSCSTNCIGIPVQVNYIFSKYSLNYNVLSAKRLVKLSQIRLEQVRPGQSRQVKSHQVRSSHVKSGQVSIGQVRSGQVRSGQLRSTQARLNIEDKKIGIRRPEVIPRSAPGRPHKVFKFQLVTVRHYLEHVIQLPVPMMGFPFTEKKRSSQVRSAKGSSNQLRSGQVRSGQVRSGQIKSGQVRSGQARPSQGT